MPEPGEAVRPAVTPAEASFDEVRRKLGLFLGPAVFIVILLVPFPNLPPAAHRLAAVVSLVIVLWVTEAIPLPVTALLGPTLAVMLGVAPVGEAFAPMANPLVFLFIGSFILVQALFVHRVNERIAYSVLSWKLIGARPARILVAYGAIAAALSAWISGTATAAMLVPIGLSLLTFIESESTVPRSYGTAVMLVTAYGCSIGGMATPVGTPPNLIAIGMLEEMIAFRITFVEWMFFAVPVTVVLLGPILVYMNFVGGAGIKEIPGAEQIIKARKRSLGSWKPGERNAMIACGVTVTLWVVPGIMPLVLGREHPAAQALLSSIPEPVAALIGAVLLFLLPISSAQRSTITWKQAAPDRLGNHSVIWRRLVAWGDGRCHGTGGGDGARNCRTAAPEHGRAADVRGGAVHPCPVGNDVEYGGDHDRRAHRDLDRSGGWPQSDCPRGGGEPRGFPRVRPAGVNAPERHRVRVGEGADHTDDQARDHPGRRGRRGGADHGLAARTRIQMTLMTLSSDSGVVCLASNTSS